MTMPVHIHMRSESRQVEVLHYGSALTSEEWEANTQSYMRELVYGNVTIDQIMRMLRTTVGGAKGDIVPLRCHMLTKLFNTGK